MTQQPEEYAAQPQDRLAAAEEAIGDVEVPLADALEQQTPVAEHQRARDRLATLEADPADAAEQDREVGLDEEEYR
jgi:hypothetical protein